MTDRASSGGGSDAALRASATRLARPPAALDRGLDRIGLRTPLARDAALAAVLALAAAGLLWASLAIMGVVDGVRLPTGSAAALTAVVFLQPLPLCLRRRHPTGALLAVAAAQLAVYAFLPATVAFQGLATFVAGYTCGLLLSTRALVRLLVVVSLATALMSGAVAGTLFDPQPLPGSDAAQVLAEADPAVHLVILTGLLSAVGCYAVPALVGVYVATRRDYVELVRLRADEAVRAQRERAENAVRAERTSMARELHDIAAHHLSGMVVQAGAAERLIGRDDDAARAATSWVRTQGRETLDSLRMVVRALREPGPDGPGADGTFDGAPVPGIAALDRLVAAERRLGADVELTHEGEPRALPPVADITVYRVAQEALTNARDHASGAPVRIVLRHGSSRVVLEVANDPPPGGSAGAVGGASRGHGLLGMRERAQLVGGRLDAAPEGPGGWRVRLEIPLTGETGRGATQGTRGER
ncbi:sensor histidine kinase [Streptomyces lonarensis]|uniref:histidine kinase n=1 Tax=Streptomyces lonarensis TaxID=700599 RepID=A0A7X6D3I0_9ACTN|nr:histidine kinase [Streptomyces lonarensis]NJQ07489.1 two-component sensor histidine kinase [Streptomyces lonarensis]